MTKSTALNTVMTLDPENIDGNLKSNGIIRWNFLPGWVKLVVGVLVIVAVIVVSADPVRSQLSSIITRISVSSAGTQSNHTSHRSSIDMDGSHVAFASLASNLVDGDTNGFADVFVYETATGDVTLVSKSTGGALGNGESDFPSISADGTTVAFQSAATNLVSGDANGAVDIFVHTIATGVTTRVSVSSAGVEGDDHSLYPSISEDGQYVTFQSAATNLVSGDDNDKIDIFVYDTTAATIERVSLDTGGDDPNGHSIYPSISADGRYLAYSSVATDIVASDGNGASDIFYFDRETDTTVRISIDSAGAESNGISTHPSISADGRYIAYESTASNLVAGDNNEKRDIFVRDTYLDTTERGSVGSGGSESNNHSGDTVDHPNGWISTNGQYIVFKSHANNLVPGDTNGRVDVFVYDRQSALTTRVSTDAFGAEADDVSYYPSISDDGKYISFYSYATNLVSDDTNGFGDVFVYDRDAQLPTSTPTPTTAPAAPTATPGPSEASIRIDAPANEAAVVEVVTSAGTVQIRCGRVFQAGLITIQVLDTPPGQLDQRFNIVPTNFNLTMGDLICDTVTVCLPYSTTELENKRLDEGALRLWHYWETDWNDVTTATDQVNNRICGQVQNFSPFVIGTGPGSDTSGAVSGASDDGSGGGSTGGGSSGAKLPASGTAETTMGFAIAALALVGLGSVLARELNQTNDEKIF